jgi:hypothetical protein
MTSESGGTGLTTEKDKSAMKSETKTLTPIEENFRNEPTPEDEETARNTKINSLK